MPPPATGQRGHRVLSGCPLAGRAQQPGQAVALPVGQRGQGIGHLLNPLVHVVVIVARRVVRAGWLAGRLRSGCSARGAFTSSPYSAWRLGACLRGSWFSSMSRVRPAEVNFAADLRCLPSAGLRFRRRPVNA